MIKNTITKELYLIKKLTNNNNIIQISKPGRKIFNKTLPYNKLLIVRTSKGIITSVKAKHLNINGETLFLIK